MKNTVVLCAIAAGLLLASVGIAQAQDSTTTQQTTTTTTTMPATSTAQEANDTHSNVRTLTGCLRSGDSSNEYELVGDNGSTWEVRSDAVNLASHVGHTVTITGAVAHPAIHGMKEDTKREAQEHGMDKSATEHGHLTVTELRMVSSSCNR